jgi:hypothetical protein
MPLDFKNWRFMACLAGAMIFMLAFEPLVLEPALFGVTFKGVIPAAIRGGLGALLGYGVYWAVYGRKHPPPKRS